MSRKGRPQTDERKEAVSKQHLNLFKVTDDRGVVIGIYRNLIQAEGDSGFASIAIRKHLNSCNKTYKGFTFDRLTVEEYKELTGE